MTKITREQLIGGDESSGSSGGGGGGDLGDHLSRVWERIQEEPQLQKVAYQAAEANGIDLAPVIAMMNNGEGEPAPDGSQTAQNQPQEVEALPAGDTARADGGGSQVEQAAPQGPGLDPEDVIGFLEEVASVHPKGEQVTVGELIRLGRNNPQIVETAIQMRLGGGGE